MSFTIHATASFGLEKVVEWECEKLGFKDLHIEDGHVLFPGDKETIALANLSLGVSDRILIEIARFPAKTFEELFQAVSNIPWERILTKDAKFPVSAKSFRSALFSLSDIQSITRKAIVTRMQKTWPIDHFPEDGALYPIEVRLRNDECVITIDTTGDGLFKRGYRARKGGAPLKETLARALVDLSVYDASRELIDPFCGSGTILIEAAMKARNIAPGLNRTFISSEWSMIGEEVYKNLRRKLLAQIDYDRKLTITGFDHNPKVIQIAKENAEEAGVAEDITFVQKDMRDVSLQESFGILITNPPYGERLGEEESAEKLMKDFANTFFPLNTWSIYVITALKNFEQIVGKEAQRRRKLFNGGIETTYYQYQGPNPSRFTR